MLSLTVCTPWHNAHELLAAEYGRVIHQVPATDQVIIVDNGSDPKIVVADDRVIVHRLEHNVGFSPACNIGLYRAETDAIVFLNNDVRTTSHDWTASLRPWIQPGVLVGAHMRNDPHAAVDDVPVPYLDGWCIAGMVADFKALGGWDESFEEPSYFGDNALCATARAHKMELLPVHVDLIHLGNYTSRRFAGRDQVTARNRARYETVVRRLRAKAAA